MPTAMRKFALVLAVIALGSTGIARAGWTPAGIRVAGPATLEALLPDGSGGALVVWVTPTTGGEQVHAQRYDSGGSVAAGWPAEGIALPHASRTSLLSAAPDGAGGVYLLTGTDTLVTPYNFGTRTDVRAWRLDGQGAPAAGWPAEGLLLDSWTLSTDSECGQFVDAWPGQRDSANGAFLLVNRHDFCPSYPYYATVSGYHVRADRTFTAWYVAYDEKYWADALTLRDGAGGVVGLNVEPGLVAASRWSASEAHASACVVCAGSGVTQAGAVPLLPGGDLLVWSRYSPSGAPDTTVARLRRLDEALQPAAGWPAEGLASLVVPVLEDGQEGAFFAVDEGGVPRLQRVSLSSPTPAVLWPGPGLPALRDGLRTIDAEGGFFQAWLEAGDTGALRAEHILPSGQPAPQWAVGGAHLSPSAASPMRATGAGSGRAIVAWTDAGADPGALYVQLLADDAPVVAGVEPSAGARSAISLRGFLANPFAGRTAVELSLPDAAPARLEVFDVSGRLVARRDVGALGAGTHRVELPELRALPPGLLFARLSRGGETRTARGTRLR